MQLKRTSEAVLATLSSIVGRIYTTEAKDSLRSPLVRIDSVLGIFDAANHWIGDVARVESIPGAAEQDNN